MNIRSCFLIFSLAISSTTIPSMNKVEADTLDCVSPITGIQKIVLGYLYEWQPRETLQCSDKIYSQTYTLDGNYLIIGLDTQQIEIYDAHTRKLLKKFDYICNGRGTAVGRLCALPNQKFLASVATAEALILYNLQNPADIKAKILSKKVGEARKIAYSNDELTLSIRGTKTMKLYQLHDDDTINCAGTYRKHTDLPYALSYSPDGKYLATGSFDQIIKISETKDYRTISTLQGMKSYTHEIRWPTNNRIISIEAYPTKLVRIWDVSSITEPKCIKALAMSGEGRQLVVSFNNKYLIFQTEIGFGQPCALQIYDLEQEKYLQPLFAPSDIPLLNISPDGRYLACASERDDARVYVWENPAAAILTAINNKNKK